MENLNEQIQQLAEKYSKDLKVLSIVRGLISSKSHSSKDYFFYLRRLRNYPDAYNVYLFFLMEDLEKKKEFLIVYASEKVTMSLQACYASNQN